MVRGVFVRRVQFATVLCLKHQPRFSHSRRRFSKGKAFRARAVGIVPLQELYLLLQQTTEDEEPVAQPAETAAPSAAKTPPDTLLKPDKTTTGYEAQFLNFLQTPKSDGVVGLQPTGKPSSGITGTPTGVAKVTDAKGTTAPKAAAPGVMLPLPGADTRARFWCRHCTYTSNTRSVMQEHIYNHTPVVPYSCGYCSAIFGTKSGVMSHTKREHREMAPMVLKTSEVREEDFYYEHCAAPGAPSGGAAGKRRAESPLAGQQPSAKRRPTARKSFAKSPLCKCGLHTRITHTRTHTRHAPRLSLFTFLKAVVASVNCC